MSRTTRIVSAFAFGATLLAAGLMLAIYNDPFSRLAPTIFGRMTYDHIGNVAVAFVLGGLIVQGMALHGWITAPRDDR